MHTTRILCFCTALAAGIGLAQPSISAPEPVPATDAKAGAIFERQFIMQRLDEDSELLGNIVAGLEPPTRLAEATRAIAKGARESVDSFRSAYPGGRSKDEVWSKHDDFMQRLESFAKGADEMAKAGDAGDLQTVASLMIDMPCKQCHDIYRAPRKAP